MGNIHRYLETNGISEKPAFNFIHQLSPHPPYMFEENCNVRENYELSFKAWDDKSRPFYVDNVKCLNRKLFDFTQFIKKRDSEAIIIITGDHGSHFKQNGTIIPGRMQVLSLSNLSEQCDLPELPSDTNSINLARIAYSCASQKHVEMLPNLMFWGDYGDFKKAKNGIVRRIALEETVLTE